jgi:hypothetical protein
LLIEEGSGPANMLEFVSYPRERLNNNTNWPIESGTVPLVLLSDRSRVYSFVSAPMHAGIEPLGKEEIHVLEIFEVYKIA